MTICGFLEIASLIFENDGSISILFKCRQSMRLVKTTTKQLLKIAYSNHKTVSICGFVEIASLIFEKNGSITLLFKCRQ